MAAPVTLSSDLTLGKPVELFRSPGFVYDPINVFPYDVTGDGSRFVVAERADESAPQKIWVRLNWFTEFQGGE